MKKIYLSNAFSLQMVTVDDWTMVHLNPVSIEQVAKGLATCNWTSAVGHQDTANVLSGILGVDVPMNRINVHLEQGDELIVAQVMGGRLPEGATTLPEGVTLKFIRVTLASDSDYEAVSHS